MLEIHDLTKRYGNMVALDGATFSVTRGRIVGFLGPNGAGKTTTMRAIFGLVRPDHGEVLCVSASWVWGVFGGVVAAAAVAPLVRRLPSGRSPAGSELVVRFLWEGIVYGAAEAILLATLPVLAVWQAADAFGWTQAGWPKAASGALAVVGAVFVIAVHHLGYREFRTRASRKKLAGALVGCGIQALAFLLTGNVLAPIVAHIALHWQLTLRGNQMPPVSDSEIGAGRPGRPEYPAMGGRPNVPQSVGMPGSSPP
jgi:energy-coupling factor transporter ATP-binding protein EcfA2